MTITQSAAATPESLKRLPTPAAQVAALEPYAARGMQCQLRHLSIGFLASLDKTAFI